MLGVFLGSAKDRCLSSFLIILWVSLEVEQESEHKTLGSLLQRSPSAVGLCCAVCWSLSLPVNAPKLPSY